MKLVTEGVNELNQTNELFNKETIKRIQKKIEEKTENKDGHLVVKELKFEKLRLSINNKEMCLYKCFHALTTGEIYNGKNIRYLQTCDVKGCISHYEPLQTKLESVLQMTYYDHMYQIREFEKLSKIVENSHKTNYHDKSESIGDCIVWTGSLHKNGYGDCKKFSTKCAHIYSYMLWNLEEVSKGQVVRHKCLDRRSCINPLHLELGNMKDNNQDKKRDGTQQKGENHINSKLTEDQVRLIREGGRNGETISQRAEKFNISSTVVAKIDYGEAWSHSLTDEEKIVVEKKRSSKKSGMGKRKLSFKDAEQIRKKYKDENVTYVDLAKQFNINETSIANIIRNKTYLPPKSEEEKLKEYFAKTRERLLKNIDKKIDENDDEHWIWKNPTNKVYGNSTWRGKGMSAHIVSYLAFKEIDINDIDWECLRHSCKYKLCINPEHLSPGTIKQNSEDMVKDGMSMRGEKHNKCKISEELALKIKKSKGQGTQKERAELFQVPKSTVTAIDHGSSWNWLSVD